MEEKVIKETTLRFTKDEIINALEGKFGPNLIPKDATIREREDKVTFQWSNPVK